MIFVVSLVFVFLFYAIPLHEVIIDRVVIFPVLGHQGSWLLTAAIIYATIGFLAFILKQFEGLFWPTFSDWRLQVTLRTGIHRLDSFGLSLSLCSIPLFFFTDMALLPLGLVSTIGFWSLCNQSVLIRNVKVAQTLKDDGGKDKTDEEDWPEEPIIKRFEWKTGKGIDQPYEGVIDLTIDRRRYERYASINPYSKGRPVVRSYQYLITDGVTKEVKELSRDLRAITVEQRFSSYQELVCILAFVQAIPYGSDKETKGHEYLRWPIETLFEFAGDSNCKAVLFAAILYALKYEIVILEAKGRTAVGVSGAEGLPGRFLTYKGKNYYYCEVNAGGWQIGQLPADLSSGQIRVYEV